MIKLSIKIGIMLFAAVSAGVLWQQAQLTVLALSQIDPLPETRAMVAAKHYAAAADYLGFFMDYEYVNRNPDAQVLEQNISNKREKWQYQAKKLAGGLFVGTSDENIGQVAGVITDFLVIGDLRDLAKQGVNLAKGEETDKVLIALASIGVIATGAQIASGLGTAATEGVAAPTFIGTTATKMSIIVLKAARKLDKLPHWLSDIIIKSAKTTQETKSLSGLVYILGDVNTLSKTRGGLNLLSKTKDAASLKRMANFTETFGSNSATLYSIGGDLIFNTVQQVGKSEKNTIKLAATYGKGGLRTLENFGAIKFVKYSTRASKMAYKGDILHLLARLLLMFPTWVFYMGIALGAFIWLPWRGVFHFSKRQP